MSRPDLTDPRLLEERAYFAGQWRHAESGERIDVTDPHDGQAFASVPGLGEAEVRAAIDLATEVQILAFHQQHARELPVPMLREART